MYHLNMTDYDIKNLMIEERRWFINRLQRQLKEEADEIEKNQKKKSIKAPNAPKLKK